jgi:hypothetical protein
MNEKTEEFLDALESVIIAMINLNLVRRGLIQDMSRTECQERLDAAKSDLGEILEEEDKE